MQGKIAGIDGKGRFPSHPAFGATRFQLVENDPTGGGCGLPRRRSRDLLLAMTHVIRCEAILFNTVVRLCTEQRWDRRTPPFLGVNATAPRPFFPGNRRSSRRSFIQLLVRRERLPFREGREQPAETQTAAEPISQKQLRGRHAAAFDSFRLRRSAAQPEYPASAASSPSLSSPIPKKSAASRTVHARRLLSRPARHAR